MSNRATRHVLPVGLVGAGRWGRNYIGTLKTLPEARLAWIADPSPAAREEFSSLCPVFTDWRSALRDGAAEALIVATPPATHAEIAQAGISAGLSVLIEKPLTLSVDEAGDILDLAAAHQVAVWVDHIHLFSPGYRRLKEFAPSLGPLRKIRSSGGRWGPFRSDASVLWDWGPHDVAMCLDLAGGKPERVSAFRREHRETAEGTGEILEIRLEFPDGIEAEILVGNILPEKTRWLAVDFGESRLILDDLAENKLTTQGGEVFPFADEPPLTCAVRTFAAAAGERKRDLSHLRLGADVVGVLGACEQALATG